MTMDGLRGQKKADQLLRRLLAVPKEAVDARIAEKREARRLRTQDRGAANADAPKTRST